MRLFIFSSLSPAARGHLIWNLPAGYTITFAADLPAAQHLTAFQQAEAVLGNVPPAWVAKGGPPDLRLWQLESMGFDPYRQSPITAPVANMGDLAAWACAETMLAGLLALHRRILERASLQREQPWVGEERARSHAPLLRAKRVIVLGAGAIARALQQQLLRRECTVLLLARTNPTADLHSKEELKTALPRTDIVVNTLPGSAHNFFSADLIAALPSNCYYASVGRGNTTDEPALIAALKAGRLAGAVLDVTAAEPRPANSPLWTLPNVLLTQHTAGSRVDQFLKNLALLQAGEEVENQVDLRRSY